MSADQPDAATTTSDAALVPTPNAPQSVARMPADIPAALRLAELEEKRFFSEILAGLPEPPGPHRASPEMVQTARRTCRAYISKIQQLEGIKQRMYPNRDPRIAYDLYKLRRGLSIFYFQLFRINDLPVEIIGHIFHIVVGSVNTIGLRDLHRIRLTSVCRRWRDIMIADSTFWKAISFTDRPLYPRSFTWFERAGSAPLSIQINESDSDWDGVETTHRFTGQMMEQLLDVLLTKLSQFRVFVVVLDNWAPSLVLMDRLRQLGAAGVPINMERFEIHRAGLPYIWLGPGQPNKHISGVPLFGGAVSSLKHLTLNGVHIDWHTPIANLTVFDVRRLPLEAAPDLMRFREILQACPNLVKLVLDGAGPGLDDADPVGLPAVQLPLLKTMVVSNYSVEYALRVLPQVAAPNVLDLTIMNLGGQDYTPFFGLITNRFPSVKVLTLYGIDIIHNKQSQKIMVQWLQSMPVVAYLRLARVHVNLLNAFLEDPRKFCEEPPHAICCPLLDYLEWERIDPKVMVAWLTNRARIGRPLQQVYIHQPWFAQQTPEQKKMLSADFRNAGLAFTILADGAISLEEGRLLHGLE